jgi:hypothetical protein
VNARFRNVGRPGRPEFAAAEMVTTSSEKKRSRRRNSPGTSPPAEAPAATRTIRGRPPGGDERTSGASG